MHVQIINFRLKGLAERDYAKVCDDLAPTFAGILKAPTRVTRGLVEARV